MPMGGVSPRFGQQREPNPTSRRQFLQDVMKGAGGVLAMSVGADQFLGTRAVASEAAPGGANARFDQLVERYFNESPGTVEALKQFQRRLAEIPAQALEPTYQGLHMLFDHHLQREVFDRDETVTLRRLGVDRTPLNGHGLDYLLTQPLKTPLPKVLVQGGIGKRRYDAMLRLENFINLDSEGLTRVAWRQFEAIEAEMKRLAAQIDAKKDWREIYRDLRKHHPKKDELLDTYRAEVAKAKGFLKDKDLISLPPDRLEVIETPDFYRGSIPYAAYIGRPGGRGTFMVTTVVDDDPAKVEEQLRAHNYGFIPPVVIHEAFPGHHLQHVHDDRVRLDEANPSHRTMSRVLELTPRNIFFIEGWGVYTEDLAREQGYYSKPEQHLFALRNILWRAARAWIDPQIHTGKMTRESAVNFLVDRVLLEPDRAGIEVDRYYQRPTDVASYLMGKLQIQQLRRQLQDQQGQRFNLKQFHDSLLAGKELPVPVLARMRFNQNLDLAVAR